MTQQQEHIADYLPPRMEYSSVNGNLRGGTSTDDSITAISMTIPRGKAVALPSITISEEEEKSINRDKYGGKGDKPHLGGFTEFDVRENTLLLIHNGAA